MTTLELLELLVQNRERKARELLEWIKIDSQIVENMEDVWANQAGENE